MKSGTSKKICDGSKKTCDASQKNMTCALDVKALGSALKQKLIFI